MDRKASIQRLKVKRTALEAKLEDAASLSKREKDQFAAEWKKLDSAIKAAEKMFDTST